MKSQQLRAFAWFDILLLLCSYYIFVWVFPLLLSSGQISKSFILTFVLVIAVYLLGISPRIHSDSAAGKGLGTRRSFFIKTDSLKRDLIAYGGLVLAGIVILVIALYFRNWRAVIDINWYSVLLKFCLYIFSASIQGLIFFSLLFLRIRYLVNYYSWPNDEKAKKLSAIIILATVFGLAHYPNWPLASLTFTFGFGLGWIFYTRPNLFLVVMCHAFFGTVLHRIFLLHMKFGLFYGQYDPQASFVRKLVPGVEALIGTKW